MEWPDVNSEVSYIDLKQPHQTPFNVELEFELAVLLRDHTYGQPDIPKLIKEFADFDDNDIYNDNLNAFFNIPNVNARIIIARAAWGQYNPENRDRKLSEFDESYLWILTDINTGAPIFFLLIHRINDIVYVDKIWRSVYGTFLQLNNGESGSEFKGMAIYLISWAIANMQSNNTIKYVVRDATTAGSKNMYERAGIQLYLIDTNVYLKKKKRIVRSLHDIKEWFNTGKISKTYEQLIKKQRIKCVICDKITYTQCDTCILPYCSHKCFIVHH